MSYEEDFYVNKRASELRTERNALVFIGFILGIGATLVTQALGLWAAGVI